jgi:hypothetical protein
MPSTDAVHVANTSCEKTAKRATERRGIGEEGEALLSFGTLVPHAEQVETFSSLARSDKKSAGILHPGNIPASAAPSKKRNTARPAKLLTDKTIR